MKMIVVLSLTVFTFCLSHQDTYAQTVPNTITFDNQSGEFAIVKLMGPTKVAVEVPNGQERTVNVEAGDYYLLGRYGSTPEKYKYTKGDQFEVTQSGRQYSVITITLHKVLDGNYGTRPVSGEKFEGAIVRNGFIEVGSEGAMANPKGDGEYVAEGNVLFAKGLYDQALTAYNRAIEINSRNRIAYYNRGIIFSRKRLHDRAITDFDSAIHIDPNYSEAYVGRGKAFYVKKLHNKAITDFTKAIEINPKNSDAYMSRGNAYDSTGLHDQAITDFTAAIKINPRNPLAYFNRAVAYFLKNDFDRAWDDVRQAQKLGHEVMPEFLEDLRRNSARQM